MSNAPAVVECDLAVVGAGPAGLAAASLAARAGLDTILFDDQPSPGGKVYRAITATPVTERAILGSDYWQGAKLVHEFLASGARYSPNATVRSLTPELVLDVSDSGNAVAASARSVIVATGAVERPFTIPGGALPGVAAAGTAQAALKSEGRVPGGRIVLAGSGPMLWLIARQLLNAGAKVEAILDTTPRANRARAAPHALGFLFSPYFRRGWQLLRDVRRRVPVVREVSAIRAEGDERVRAVAYRCAGGSAGRVPVDHLLLHRGLMPNVTLGLSAGIAHRWDDAQVCSAPVLDAYGGTSSAGILVAGDAAGIGGAQAAAWRGVLSAIAVVSAIQPDRKLPVEKLAHTALAHFGRGRKFLDALYRPSEPFGEAA